MTISANEQYALDNIDLLDYFNKYVSWRKKGVTTLSGSVYATLCPFHKESDPSFHHYTNSKNVSSEGIPLRYFKCFGCGIYGNVVDLFIRTESTYEGRSYHSREDAVVALLHLYNLEVQETVEDVFTQAKNKLHRLRSVSSNPLMNITRFTKLNSDIIDANVPEDIKIKRFAEIDRMACAVMMNE